MKKESRSLALGLAGCAVLSLCIILGAISTPASVAQDGKAPNGAPIFKEHECQGCHSVEEANIALDIGDLDPEEVDEDAPDLSGVGNRHEIDWMKLYLKKKVEQNGEKHEKKFRGSDEDLDTLTKWLSSLKAKGK